VIFGIYLFVQQLRMPSEIQILKQLAHPERANKNKAAAAYLIRRWEQTATKQKSICRSEKRQKK